MGLANTSRVRYSSRYDTNHTELRLCIIYVFYRIKYNMRIYDSSYCLCVCYYCFGMAVGQQRATNNNTARPSSSHKSNTTVFVTLPHRLSEEGTPRSPSFAVGVSGALLSCPTNQPTDLASSTSKLSNKHNTLSFAFQLPLLFSVSLLSRSVPLLAFKVLSLHGRQKIQVKALVTEKKYKARLSFSAPS